MKIEKEAEEKIRKILKKEEAGELKDGNTVVFGPAVSPEDIVDVSEQVKTIKEVDVGKAEIRDNKSIIPLENSRRI